LDEIRTRHRIYIHDTERRERLMASRHFPDSTVTVDTVHRYTTRPASDIP
jgi:hypothetical protein